MALKNERVIAHFLIKLELSNKRYTRFIPKQIVFSSFLSPTLTSPH